MSQPLELLPTHASVFLVPSVTGLRRHADLPHRLRYGLALPLQNFNPPQFQHDLFGSSGLSLPSHLLVLLKTG